MKPSHLLSSTAALVTLLALGSNASAQDAPPGTAPPPPQPPPVMYTQPAPYPPPGAVVVAAPGQPPPVTYTQPAQSPCVVDAEGQIPPWCLQGYPHPPSDRDHARVRFGIEMGGGYMFAVSHLASAHGGAGNLRLRLGVQINNPWAVYVQSSLLAGYALGTSYEYSSLSGEALAGAAGGWTNGLIVEYTRGNLLHFGLGPSFDMVASGICSANAAVGNGAKAECIASAGKAFGVTGRIAATFGFVRPSRRHALSVGLDLHPTFTPSGTFFFSTLNLGYEAF